MKRNRILALSVVLLLALQLLTPLACAAGATVTVTAPDKLPAVGETFTITVDLSGNTGLSALQLKLGYDDSIVECTGVENGDLVGGMLSASNPHGTRGGTGAILAAASTDAVKRDGSLVTFTFKVKKTGDAKLSLAESVLSDASGKDMSVSYALPSLVSQSTGSGSGSTAEGKPADGEKPEDGEKTDGEQEEVQTGTFRDVNSLHWAFASGLAAGRSAVYD